LRDRDLVRLYWPAELRPAFDALLDIDEALADVVARATEPALAAIKLAWWRERLADLDQGRIPAEPRLRAAAEHLLPRGIGGAALAGLEDGWASSLEGQPDVERVGEHGERLFAIAAGLLDFEDPRLAGAGRLYGCAAARRRGLAVPHFPIDALAQLARHRFPPKLRPLTALAKLAVRDARRAGTIEPEGTPGRALALIAHRLTGRVA
jgi:phytoene synthase